MRMINGMSCLTNLSLAQVLEFLCPIDSAYWETIRGGHLLPLACKNVIPQFDGNATCSSILSSELEILSQEEQCIQVIVNVFKRKSYCEKRDPCRKTIKRSNRIADSSLFPVIGL